MMKFTATYDRVYSDGVHVLSGAKVTVSLKAPSYLEAYDLAKKLAYLDGTIRFARLQKD